MKTRTGQPGMSRGYRWAPTPGYARDDVSVSESSEIGPSIDVDAKVRPTDAQHEVERVFRESGARLERALLLYSGNREVARDALAEAFAQALRRGDALREPERWVTKVAFRLAAAELRRQAGLATEVPHSSYELPEPAVDLGNALAKLSTKQRASLVLHHYLGYGVSDVARLIGSTSAAVTVHLVRARRRMRELMEDPR